MTHDEPFTLSNAPSKRSKQRFEDNPSRQLTLLSGLDCLPGQQDLFATDGEQPMLDDLFYDNSFEEWRVNFHRSNGYSRDYPAEFAEGVPEPRDRDRLYACTARLQGDEAIVSEVEEE